MTSTVTNVLRQAGYFAAALLFFATPAAAQNPTFSVSYELVRSIIEPRLNQMIEDDGRLDWGDEPHLTVVPSDASGPLNSELRVFLNLKGKEEFIGIDINAKITVDVRIYAVCESNHVRAFLNGVHVDTDLPGWVEDLAGIEVPEASLQGFVDMASGLLSSQECGDVKLWQEGVLVFPKDTFSDYAPAGSVSTCLDSTFGRVGRVAIQDGQIVAQIDAGASTRWPDFGAQLHVWVSPTGTDAGSHELDETRIVSSFGEDQRMFELAAGQGLVKGYALPADAGFVGCSIEGTFVW